MAETMLSEAVKRMMDLMLEEANYHVKLVRGAKKEVLSLEKTLTTINGVLNDAEKRSYKEESVKNWLIRLQQTSYEMEDILDESDYAILKLRMKQKVRSFFVSSFSCSCFNKLAVRHQIALKIENVKEQFDKLLKEKDQFEFLVSHPIDQPSPKTWRASTSFPVVRVRGRDKHCSTLVDKLTGNGGGIQVVSIVGVGGLGKTTIAQKVYHHTHVEKHFDLRIWVCVSDPFDLAAIAKGIIESDKKEDPPSTNNLETLWQSVRDIISGKKFLLVLDDIWTEDYADRESLERHLRFGGEGSKILVTTRKEKVAKIMGTMDGDIIHPYKLSHDDCWLLMRRIACPRWEERMESDQERREFEEIGKEIAKKCDGLPLAARTLGSLLLSKSTLGQWEVVLNSDIWEMKEVETGLFRHLLLSYNELSPSVKRCFSYCGVYPQDYKIDVEVLIQQWSALGYLVSDATGSDMEKRGQEYFEIIAMHSLFQDIEKDPDGKILYCKMHDIVHDFAKFLRKSNREEATSSNKCQTCLDRDPPQISTVNEFRSFFWDEKESPPILCDCLTRIRVLSMRNCSLEGIPLIVKKFIHLGWLNLSYNELSHEDLKIIFKLYNLKTLELSSCSLEEIPTQIGNLVRLTHLNLSSNELTELPREIGNLVRLRKLNLRLNRSLTKLPETICGLHELRTLDVKECRLCKILDGLAQLSSLSSLTEFRGGSCWSKLELLNNLTHLGQNVMLIIRLGGDIDLESVVEDAKLRNMKDIESLVIQFEDEKVEASCSRKRMDVIDALEPHPNLKQLVIENYKGSKLPGWIASPLNQLKNLSLGKCHHLTALPSLGKLPCLEFLFIVEMEGLEIVGREFLGFTGCSSNAPVISSFPMLVSLSIKGCGKWKEWEDITAEEEASPACSIMPSLEVLRISDCNGLTALPHRLIRKASHLETLHIWGSTQLEKRYLDMDDADIPQTGRFVIWSDVLTTLRQQSQNGFQMEYVARN